MDGLLHLGTAYWKVAFRCPITSHPASPSGTRHHTHMGILHAAQSRCPHRPQAMGHHRHQRNGARRGRAQDVQVQGQHHPARRGDERVWGRCVQAVGCHRGLYGLRHHVQMEGCGGSIPLPAEALEHHEVFQARRSFAHKKTSTEDGRQVDSLQAPRADRDLHASNGCIRVR